MEEVARAAPDSFKIFQIYLSKVADVNKDIWSRVKQAGYSALALTLDTQVFGKRESDVRNGFQLPTGLGLANFTKYKVTSEVKSSGQDSGLAEYVRDHKDSNIGWEVIPEIKRISGLPVIAKGIMCYEDALIAIQHGADALHVSNHGAR